MKKLISTALIVFICLTLVIPVNAVQNVSVNDKANALNKISIISGDSRGLNLSGGLLKCEAAVFITRLLGKVDEVLQNKDSYDTSMFSDVPSNAWYKPYVGYCAGLGIVTGYNGKFEPNSKISEKSFLSMVIRAIGYVYVDDFTWSNVYQTAYNIGLVTDVSYRTKVNDNTKYLRSDVVNVLYNAIRLKKKGSSISILQELINDNIIQRSTAVAAGIINDTVQTGISQVTVVNEQSLSVTFNENIRAVSATNIQVYETNNSANKLTVELTSISGNQIVLKTSAQVPDKGYTLELLNAEDVEGNFSDKLTVSFTGYRNPELKSDFFKISKIEPVNKKVINLYFTQPINSTCESAAFYEILENGNSFVAGNSQSIVVRKLNSVNNGITIFLKEKAFADGASYTLKISGSLTSTYGVKLNDEAGDSIVFKGKGTDYDSLRVLSIMALNSTKLYVEFNREVDPSFAQKFLNYTIIAPDNSQIAVSKAVISGDGSKSGKVVLLSLLSPLDKTKEYTLKLEYIPDIYRQSVLEENRNTFLGTYPDKTDLGIKYVLAVDRGTIWVGFDRPLNPEVAAVNSVYAISGITNTGYFATPAQVFYQQNGDQYIAKLYLSNDKLLVSSNTYKMTVMGVMQDIYGNTSSKNIDMNFNGTDTAIPKPGISDAVIISKDTIRVAFNKELANDIINIQPSNYSLEYDDGGSVVPKSPLFASLIDSTTVILKFDSLNMSTKYKLKYNSIKDYSGTTITSGNSTSSFDVRVGK